MHRITLRERPPPAPAQVRGNNAAPANGPRQADASESRDSSATPMRNQKVQARLQEVCDTQQIYGWGADYWCFVCVFAVTETTRSTSSQVDTVVMFYSIILSSSYSPHYFIHWHHLNNIFFVGVFWWKSVIFFNETAMGCAERKVNGDDDVKNKSLYSSLDSFSLHQKWEESCIICWLLLFSGEYSLHIYWRDYSTMESDIWLINTISIIMIFFFFNFF